MAILNLVSPQQSLEVGVRRNLATSAPSRAKEGGWGKPGLPAERNNATPASQRRCSAVRLSVYVFIFVHDKNFQYVMNFTTQNEVHEII